MRPGDRVLLNIAGDEETITGTYVISEDGMLLLPGINAIDISGLTLFAAERKRSGNVWYQDDLLKRFQTTST